MHLLLVLMALAAWRLTHLIVEDDFPPIRWARDRISAHGPEWLGDLVTCTWCAGVWVAAAVTATVDWQVGVRWPWLTFGAVAALVPIVEAVVVWLEREPAAPPVPAAAAPQPTTYTRTRG